jgi:uncharacterized protein
MYLKRFTPPVMIARKDLLKQGFWFFLFNSLCLLLIATRYFQYFYDINSFLTIFYLIIATISHFASLSLLLYLILYVPVILIFPNRKLAWIWAAVISLLSSSVLLFDTFVYKLYHFHINSFVLELVFGGAGGQIFEFHYKQYILIFGFLIFALLTLLYLSFRFFALKRFIHFKKGLLLIAVVLFMMVTSHFIHAWASASSYLPITKSSRYYPLYLPLMAEDLIENLGLIDKTESQNNRMLFTDIDKTELDYPKHQLNMDTSCKTNIILIMLDSWYYKSFDSVAMPNLYKFSGKCEIYNHHYSGSNGTRTGVFSLFYSIPGIYWDDVLASQIGSIFVDALLLNNYRIKLLTSASLISPPFDRTIFKKVKDLNTDKGEYKAYERDKQITYDFIKTLNDLKKDNRPLFCFLFYDALHAIAHPASFKGPFQPEWEYAKYELLSNNTDPTPFLNLYKNTAYYVDSLLGIVLADLKSKGMLENSWIIFTGDHGQEFNDNKMNYWGHNGNYTAAQMQVPLMVYKPGGIHRTYSHWTSHYDIVPSVFSDLFHCKNPINDYSIGKLLTDSLQRNWLLVGSKDNFAILEPDRITNIYYDGSFDITNSHLGEIKNAKMSTKFVNEIMFHSKSFYKN